MVVSVNAPKAVEEEEPILEEGMESEEGLLKKVKALMRKLIQKKLKAKDLKRARNSA